MKHIFYLFGIFFIIYELMWVLSPKVFAANSKKLSELRKENKWKKHDDMSEEYKDLFISRGVTSLIMTIWLVSGLMTFNWFPFLAILLWSFVIITPLSLATKFSPAYTVLHWFDSLVGAAFGIFVTVNSYHLQIDVYELFIRWINH